MAGAVGGSHRGVGPPGGGGGGGGGGGREVTTRERRLLAGSLTTEVNVDSRTVAEETKPFTVRGTLSRRGLPGE